MSNRWGKQDSVPEGQQRAEIHCMNGCTGSKSSTIMTWAIGGSRPHFLCPSCKNGNWEGQMQMTRKHAPKALDPTVWRGNPIHTFRPGDPGFSERAAECTPIHLIHNMSKGAKFCFDLEAKQRIIRREKMEALDS